MKLGSIVCAVVMDGVKCNQNAVCSSFWVVEIATIKGAENFYYCCKCNALSKLHFLRINVSKLNGFSFIRKCKCARSGNKEIS